MTIKITREELADNEVEEAQEDSGGDKGNHAKV